MFCRKRNLYNETFNSDSMVDILRSLPLLSSDLVRIVGQALIMENVDDAFWGALGGMGRVALRARDAALRRAAGEHRADA